MQQKKRDVGQTEWGWPMSDSQKSHSERAALLREIRYEITGAPKASPMSTQSGQALSLNISSGGILLLMDQSPEVTQVLKVHVPTPILLAGTPTLAEVCWTKRLPLGKPNGPGLYFVGLRFMF
jgi:hypothetical protein